MSKEKEKRQGGPFLCKGAKKGRTLLTLEKFCCIMQERGREGASRMDTTNMISEEFYQLLYNRLYGPEF